MACLAVPFLATVAHVDVVGSKVFRYPVYVTSAIGWASTYFWSVGGGVNSLAVVAAW